jgi:hypothetical protein
MSETSEGTVSVAREFVSEIAELDTSSGKCGEGLGMTMHQCCAILAPFSATGEITFSQLKPLRKSRFYRELWL